MTIPTNLLTHTATHRRLTNVLLSSQTLPFSEVLTRTDSQPIFVQFQASGLTGDAEISIVGTLSGVTQNETVQITQSGTGIKRSTNRYDSVTNLSSTNAGGSVVAEAYYSVGPAPQKQTQATITGRLRQRRIPSITETGAGSVLEQLWMWYTNATTLLSGDFLTIDGTEYEVLGIYDVYGHSTLHHAEVELKRLY
jgi:hypothetical protein